MLDDINKLLRAVEKSEVELSAKQEKMLAEVAAEDKRAKGELAAARAAFELEKSAAADQRSAQASRVTLDVGGTKFTTSKVPPTLLPPCACVGVY